MSVKGKVGIAIRSNRWLESDPKREILENSSKRLNQTKSEKVQRNICYKKYFLVIKQENIP